MVTTPTNTDTLELEAQRTREERANRDTRRLTTDMEFNGFALLQLLFAIFFGDQGQKTEAITQFSTALGLDPNTIQDTLGRVSSGEISAFRAATETFASINPDNIDHAALGNINVADLVGSNQGSTLLHPDLVKRMQSDPQVAHYVDLTFKAAENHGLDPALLANQFWIESRFKPNAQSGAGAMGIAQFMPFHEGKWGLNSRADFFDPEKSIEAGAQFMAHLTQKYGSQSLALVAYNGGGGAIDWVENNTSGPVTVGSWIQYASQERAEKGVGASNLWRNQTFDYVTKIDSNFWSAGQIAEARALNAQAMASLGREVTPEQNAQLASAEPRIRNGELRILPPLGEKSVLTSDFGPRDLAMSSMHHGVDFKTTHIDPNGEVSLRARQTMTYIGGGYERGFGNRAIFALGTDDRGRTITVQYAHLSALPKLQPGVVVNPGDYIGTTGATGRITGPHLDYQVRIGEQTVDPMLAFETDLADAREGDRLIANAQATLGNRAHSGTYAAMIEPSLRNPSVRNSIAALDDHREEQAHQQVAAATNAPPAAEPTTTAAPTIDQALAPTGTPQAGALTTAFGTGKGTKEKDPVQPEPLTPAFDGVGRDQIAAAAAAAAAAQQIASLTAAGAPRELETTAPKA